MDLWLEVIGSRLTQTPSGSAVLSVQVTSQAGGAPEFQPIDRSAFGAGGWTAPDAHKAILEAREKRLRVEVRVAAMAGTVVLDAVRITAAAPPAR